MAHNIEHTWEHYLLQRPSDYWKLRKYGFASVVHMKRFLQSVGYHCNTSHTKSKMTALLARYEQDFLSYSKCTIRELKSFVVQRDLAIESHRKSSMIQSLEEADDNITFDKFLDLPPEVRERIYGNHLDSLNLKGLVNALPPPITRTCKVVRHESLSMRSDSV
ncbi:unnamed protein product [Zymoseptoria tritici ST99CH_3D1]|nr:unnamed protein product [Zymoseptoria tritici ST99CH_3D1]